MIPADTELELDQRALLIAQIYGVTYDAYVCAAWPIPALAEPTDPSTDPTQL